MNLDTVEIKAFVPARDFAASKAFYQALGFAVPWSSDDLAYVHHGDTSFLLQRCDAADHASHFMMHLLVANADDWHAHAVASGVVERFGVRLTAPEDRPWRIRDFCLTDPAGVLWRIGHNLPGGRAPAPAGEPACA
ncbi:MAG: VOC family protein [Lysobacteraceae bacterium]